MTKKKTPAEFGAKAAFVRAAPKTLSAKQVVEAAKAKGMILTDSYVYTVRSGSSKSKKGKPGPKPGSGQPVQSTTMTPAEAQLRNAIADLGLVRAGQILESVRATIRGR